MDNYKKIFSEILEESNIPPLKKTFLFEKTYEIFFELYEEKNRHYRVEFVVEENWKAVVRSDLKKLKKELTSLFKKKLICNSVKFEPVFSITLINEFSDQVESEIRNILSLG